MRKVLNTIKPLREIVLCVVLAGGMLGCGSASNNDQGTSFTLLGFFEAIPDDPFSCEDIDVAPVLGADVPLASFSDEGDEDGLVNSGAIRAVVGVQNNLSGQFVRTKYADIEYVIAGADINPPATRVGVGVLVNPSVAPSDSEEVAGAATGSTLPDSFSAGDSACSAAFANFTVVPPDVRSWINFNQGSLPEAPFVMNAIVRIVGETSAGDTITSNEGLYSIQFTPAIDIQSPDDSDGGSDDIDDDVVDAGDTGGSVIP